MSYLQIYPDSHQYNPIKWPKTLSINRKRQLNKDITQTWDMFTRAFHTTITNPSALETRIKSLD